MIFGILRWRRRSKVRRLIKLGDQRLIRGEGGTNYDGFGYQL